MRQGIEARDHPRTFWPSGPPRAWIDGNAVLAELLKVRVGLHRPLWQLGSAAHHCDGLARYHELSQVNGYPFHPSGQDMISAAPVRRASSKAPNTPNLETTQRFAASPCATMNFSAFHTTQKSRMGPGNWRFV